MISLKIISMLEFMNKKVSIIDYGLCNLYNVVAAFESMGASVELVESKKKISEAEYLVLPGVGAFKDGMSLLNKKNLTSEIINHIQSNKPFLGICLGMQMMFDKSFEFGEHNGLGVINGDVIKIPSIGSNMIKHKIPHIGWNNLVLNENISNNFANLASNNDSMYFVHSFMANKINNDNILAHVDYNGIKIPSIITIKKSIGCQFHPEKSGKHGLSLLHNFLDL